MNLNKAKRECGGKIHLFAKIEASDDVVSIFYIYDCC